MKDKPAQAELVSPELPIAKRDTDTQVAPSSLSGVDINALFSKAVEQGSAMEVIKELRAMESELYARKAKIEFNKAMALFQQDCPTILKEKGVPDKNNKIAYKYSPIEAVETQIRPFEVRHGFTHKFPETKAEPGWVGAVCLIQHNSGHEERASVRYPIGTKTLIMSDTQVYAAAETFCKRRALCNGYGLILAGEDLDGQTGRIKPQGPSAIEPPDTKLKALAQELWTLLKPIRGNADNWQLANQWLWREEVLDGAIPEEAPMLSAARFKEVIAKAREKMKE